jgi:hypothetical protein
MSDPFQLQYSHRLFQSQVISLFRLQHNVKLFQSKMIYPLDFYAMFGTNHCVEVKETNKFGKSQTLILFQFKEDY